MRLKPKSHELTKGLLGRREAMKSTWVVLSGNRSRKISSCKSPLCKVHVTKESSEHSGVTGGTKAGATRVCRKHRRQCIARGKLLNLTLEGILQSEHFRVKVKETLKA